jgi:GT2 family glycosyltransferase
VSDAITASIIILGHNGEGFLPGCIASALDQTYPAERYEVIYADNASTDGSAEIVEEQFPGVRLVRFDHNLGFSQGNNRAAELARGRYLAFLNQDTVTHRRWLEELVKAVERSPRARAAHAAGLPLHDEHLEREARIERAYISEVSRYGSVEPREILLPDGPMPTLHVGGGAMLLDRQVVGELDYIFDPRFFAYCEDLDLGLRLNGLGYQVLFVPTAICYHYRSGRTRLSRQTLWRLGMATRHRFLAYAKNMHGDEFLLALPRLFLGSFSKMSRTTTSPVRRMIYGLGLLLFTAYQFLGAVVQVPRYGEDRRRVLKARSAHRQRHWLRHTLRAKGARIAVGPE